MYGINYITTVMLFLILVAVFIAVHEGVHVIQITLDDRVNFNGFSYADGIITTLWVANNQADAISYSSEINSREQVAYLVSVLTAIIIGIIVARKFLVIK